MVSRLMSPELKAAFRHRIRHIHLPDLAPHYAPRALPFSLRDFLEAQIVTQRDVARARASVGRLEPSEASKDNLVDAMRSWLREASPPPTVLSFTRRPTYILPAHYIRGKEPWEVEYLTNVLKGPQQVVFPEPPGWSATPYRPLWNAGKEDAPLHNPLSREWMPGVLSMPCAEPAYYGPGQISIWPVIDLQDHFQRGKGLATKYEYERLLEDTTIQVLKREYGLDAFAIPGKSGVWVESLIPPSEIPDIDVYGINTSDKIPPARYAKTRRIATVHADFWNDITRFGISIHVSQPARSNPWAPLRQGDTTTSIASELALKGSAPQPEDPDQRDLEHRSQKKSLYLRTVFEEDSLLFSKSSPAMPYSMTSLQPGQYHPTPMGMDNRDLSTAWTYEFARQLGRVEGVIDHLAWVDYGPEPTEIPVRQLQIGFKSRRVVDESLVKTPCKQVDVPSIQLKRDGSVPEEILDATRSIVYKDNPLPSKNSDDIRALSWPMYFSNITKMLKKSIGGMVWDTRLSQLTLQQTIEADKERRWQAIEESELLRDAWRVYQRPRIYFKDMPLSAAMQAEIARNMEDVKVLLRQIGAGRVTVPKAKLERKMALLERLLEPFIQDSDGTSGTPTHATGKEQALSRGSTEEAKKAANSEEAAMLEEVTNSEDATSTASEKLDISSWQPRIDGVIKVAEEVLDTYAAKPEAVKSSTMASKSRMYLGNKRNPDKIKKRIDAAVSAALKQAGHTQNGSIPDEPSSRQSTSAQGQGPFLVNPEKSGFQTLTPTRAQLQSAKMRVALARRSPPTRGPMELTPTKRKLRGKAAGAGLNVVGFSPLAISPKTEGAQLNQQQEQSAGRLLPMRGPVELTPTKRELREKELREKELREKELREKELPEREAARLKSVGFGPLPKTEGFQFKRQDEQSAERDEDTTTG